MNPNAHQWKASLNPETVQSADLKEAVHVWAASLSQSTGCLELLGKTLSIDEVQRAGRFHFARDRRRFIAARGILRVILSRYLSLPPQQIQFQYSVNGKPGLAEEFQDGSLQFNLTHSGELALYALTSKRQIGVDIEALQPVPQAEEIASQFFSENECVSIMRLPKTQRAARFFELWTCKEAYLKALGVGLSQPLNQFEIVQTASQTKGVINLNGQRQEPSLWTIVTFQPDVGYTAALAVDSPHWCLQYGQWDPTDFLFLALWDFAR